MNNFEEQFLLGTDTYTITYIDENENTIIEKSFHKNDIDHSQNKNYYKIITYIYKNDQPIEDNQYYFEENSIYFPYSPKDVVFGKNNSIYPNENALYMLNDLIFNINNDQVIINPSYINRKDELHYITDLSEDILILTKYTIKKEINNKEILIENIKNHLI